jgi:hypothetical protein
MEGMIVAEVLMSSSSSPSYIDVILDGISSSSPVVSQNPLTGAGRQHESQEARSLYPSALQLTRALKMKFVGRAT